MAQTPSFRDEWYRLRRPAAVYVLLLGIMEGYAEHIADALITGAEAEDKGGGEGTGGPLVFIRLFAAFALLNLAFRRARYPGGTFLRVSRLYPRSPLPLPHQQ